MNLYVLLWMEDNIRRLRNLALILFVAVFITACGAGGGGTNVTVSDVGNVEGTVTGSSSSVALSGVTVQIGDKTAKSQSNIPYPTLYLSFLTPLNGSLSAF